MQSLCRSSPAVVAALALAACTHIGPGTIPRDRFDYGAAITDSWKRQTLLNIVKLRYLDPPIFVDVGQIVSGYTLETGLSASAAVSSDPAGAAVGGSSAGIGGSVRFTDRPTITYVPMTGNRFVRGLMMPLPPETLFQTILAGWPADGILAATCNTINGLDNAHASIDGMTRPEPEFLRALQLLREIQASGVIGMRVHKDGPSGSSATVLVFRRANVPAEITAKREELRTLLGLDPGADTFKLAFGATAQDGKEIAMVTRSVLHILSSMAMGVDVPASDIAEGRATPGLAADDTQGRLVRVHCSETLPENAYVTVRYRERHYWIDDRDLRSKRAFAFMMMLFTLSDPAAAENAPVITIPA